ncbi:DUF4375 domain-containing protein [Lysobacter cavernae]|uniref:DUF4375 domain-containing protein n=1 Tax=Lysobacter cavernae TaxID=1685901 RepID=A0ABV7RWZ5_9GAMM
MPCATGTRESIEASKEHYTKQRELDRTDPVRILWRSLVARMHHTDGGYLSLSDAEKRYVAVGLLDGEVYNGGFDQYFFNSASSYYSDALLGLEGIGATTSLELLLKAKKIVFGFDSVPVDTSARRQISRPLSASQSSRLDHLDKLFWADPDNLSDRIEAFLRRHSLIRDVA